MATAGKDQGVRLWRLVPGEDGAQPSAECIASYSGHTDCVEGLAVSPDGSQLCSCSWDGAILLWRTGVLVNPEPQIANPRDLSLRPDGSQP